MANATATKSMRLSETTAQEWEKLKVPPKMPEEAIQTLIAAYTDSTKKSADCRTDIRPALHQYRPNLSDAQSGKCFTQRTADVQCALKMRRKGSIR